MATEIWVGLTLLSLMVGLAVGFVKGKGRNNSDQIRGLEEALANSQTELSDYRREVLGQFAQTAEKFKALDESYHDLHRQLAQSSAALCGDEGTQLLVGPESEAPVAIDGPVADSAERRREKEVKSAFVDDDSQSPDSAGIAEPVPPEAPLAETPGPSQPTERSITQTSEPDDAAAEAVPAVDQQSNVLAESIESTDEPQPKSGVTDPSASTEDSACSMVEVPTLTETATDQQVEGESVHRTA